MDHLLSRPDEMAMHINRQRMLMSAQKFPIPSETDHLMQPDGSLVDVSRTLSSIGPMGMPLMGQIGQIGQLGQMQLHQISPAMLQSLAPPHLHAIGPQLHPTLHPLHPHIAQLQSMVHVVPHHDHMHPGPGMEGPVIEGTQPLDAIVAAAAVSDESELQRKKQKAAKGSCKPPFNCAHCGKVYNKKYHLTRHERCHNNIKPYTCPQCPKAFVESGDLKKHVRVHTHDRPYKCVSCPATFTQSSSLRVHERVHKGVRYTCDQCHHQFTRNYFLQQHKRRHGTMDKEYSHDLVGVVGVPVPHSHHGMGHSSDADTAAVVVQAVQVLQNVERVELAAAAASGVSSVPMVPSVPVPQGQRDLYADSPDGQGYSDGD